MSEPKGKFTMRLNSALTLDRIYRVYLDNAAAYFINLGSPSGIARAVGRQFGVIGRMLAESYERKQAVKRAEMAAELDREHPGILLSRDKACPSCRSSPPPSSRPPSSAATARTWDGSR